MSFKISLKMASKRRKQLQPRHIAKDHQILTETLENEVLMEYGRSPLRSFDNHICGRCSADFFTMPAFIMHKKQCTNEWPVIVSAPATSSSLVVMRTTTTTDETKASYGSDENDADADVKRYENNVGKAIDLYEKSSNPIVDVDENANKMNGKVFSAKLSPSGLRSGTTGVARIQTALASLQRQQMLQLQLIKNIYGQLLKSTKFSISDDVSDNKFLAECTKNNDRTMFTVDSFKINILSSSKQLKRNIAHQLNEQRKSMEKLFETRCQLCDKDVGNLKKTPTSQMYQNEDLNDDFIRALLGEEIDDNIFKGIYDYGSSSQDSSETGFDEHLYLNVLQDLKLEEDETEGHKNSAGTITVQADLQEDVKNYSDIRLDLHMKNVHGTELISMSQFCEDCYECFKSQEELDDHTRIQHRNIKEEPTVLVEKENEILLHPTMNFQQNESPPSSSTKNTIEFNADGDEHFNDAAEKIIDAIQTSTTTERYTLTNLKLQSNNSNVKNDEIWNQHQDFYCSDVSAPGSFLGTPIGQSSRCTPIGPSSRCTPMDFESPTMVNLIKNNNNFDKFESDDSLNFVHISTPDIGDKQHEPISPVESYHDEVSGAKMVLDDDDDWEDLMEVANMDEASEIRQLAGDAATKTADRNECIICHKILSCKSALQMHYRTHTGTRPFKCKVCQRAFTTKGNLKTHMSVHKTKSSSKLFYHCPVCQKAFINSSSLHEHLSVHHSGTAPPKVEKVVPTTVFLPAMSSAMARCHNAIEMEASNLHRNGSDLHKDSNGSKIDVASTPIMKQYAAVNNPHETICRICFERFANANLLEIHMNSHTRKKPYICEMCGRGFSTRGNLKQHRDSIHFSSTPGTPNNNNGQEQNFDFQALNGEIGDRLSSRSHSEPDNQTTSADNKHSNLDFVKNNAKNGSSVRNDDMNLAASYNNKTLCHICMKQCCSPSILQIHMRSHTGDRPFECNVCNRSFSTKGNLKAHMEIHTYSSDSLRGRRYFSTVMPKTLKFREQKNVETFRISRRNSKTLSVERQSPLKSPVFPVSPFNPVMHNNFNRSLAFLPHNQPFYEPTVSTDSLMFRPEFSMGGFQPNFNQHLMNGFNNVSSSTNDPSSVYHPSKSMDAMVQMFRIVCSLCHKVCSSTSELEIHLKTHFCQSDVNIQVLKT